MKKNRIYGLMGKIGLLKMIKIMRFAIFIFFLSLSQTFAMNSYSQQTKISLDMRNVRVEDVIDKIEKNSEFLFMYNRNLIDVDRKVDIQVEEKSIIQILDKIFENTGITYSINGRQILLINNSLHPELENLNAQQQKSVSGKVTDSSGGPLPGVSVIVKGTTSGTISDADGKYTLINVPEKAILQFSFVGMKTQEVAVGNKTSINITLEDETIGLDEVVAVGYGTVKKSDLTGALSSLSGEKLGTTATSRVVEALQGKIAGVSIAKASGRPGDGVKVRIRGIGTVNNSNPLYVVDGIPTENMDNVEANDIQSIEILKDASSTAIYGSRGANGVVLVTTKSGTMKSKTDIAINSYMSIDHIKQIKLMDGYQWAKFYQEAAVNDGTPFTGDKLNLINDAIANKTVGTNWQDEVFQTGITQNHQISATGGLEGKNGYGLNYYLSGSYNDQKGIIKNSNFSRYNLLSKLELKVSKNIKVGAEFSYTSTDRIGGDSKEITGDPLGQAMRACPLMTPKNADGTWGSMWFNDQQDNPANMVTRTKDYYTKGSFLATKGWFQINLLKGLSFKSIYNRSNSVSHVKNFSPSYYINAAKNQVNSTLSEGYTQYSGWYWNNLLNYEGLFNSSHNIKMTLGHEASYNKYDGFNLTATSGLSEDADLQYIDRASTWGSPKVNIGASGMESFFGRLIYSYQNKYILNTIVRRDGSYKFSDSNKWGTFPSFGFAWISSEESFIKNLNFFDGLKFRINWGRVGNESSADAYSYLSTVNTSNMYYSLNGTSVTRGGIPTSTVNPDLKWETVESTNIGIDAKILKNRLSLSADYFIKNTKDMIIQVPSPSYTSNSDPFMNVGAMQNKGLELSIGYTEQFGDFSLNLNGNISFISNKVTDLGSKAYIQGGYISTSVDPQYITRTEVGQEVAYFIGYQYLGIYKTQEEIKQDALPNASKISVGDARFLDKNGDHVLDSKDYVNLGSAIPDYLYGINGNFSYKNWDLSLSIVGSQGNEIANMLIPFISKGEIQSNLTLKRLDRYSATANPNGSQPRATIIDPNKNFFKMSNQFIEDGSFLKIKSVQLGYSLPKSLISRMNLNSIRFYLTAQNLFTFTKYSGFDPEITEYIPGNSNTSLAAGIDLANYPLPRSIITGVSISF